MGLNESFDNTRNQILVLDPLAKVNKAYSIVLRVEKQRRVNLEYVEAGENSAMQVRTFEQKANKAQVVNDNEQRRPIKRTNAAVSDLVSKLMEALRIMQSNIPQDPTKRLEYEPHTPDDAGPSGVAPAPEEAGQ
ncbi:UNVERIFIED_CONTAM: hypothetical protein Scaly_2641200 [Sesamum calycinum]|uniref:Uncharacterized protein n=1 Tax=Sesamum calycinum TaxID=2727403 RepID=A0AAW2JAQ0_9LAMI